MASPQIFNPFKYTSPLAIPNCVAPSAFVKSSHQFNVAVSPNENDKFVLLSFSYTNVRSWYIDGTSIYDQAVPNLTSSGAKECRGARLGLRIINTTKADEVSGSVRVVNIRDPLDLTFASTTAIDTASRDKLLALAQFDGRTIDVSAHNVAMQPLDTFCHPVNILKMAATKAFLLKGGSTTEAVIYNFSELDSGMSQVLINFRGGSAAATYACHVVSHDYLRFEDGTLLAGMHRDPPQNHQSTVEAMRQAYAKPEPLRA